MLKILYASILTLCPLQAIAAPACGFYQYKADIVSITDGDTVRADIDLGFNTWRRDEPLRLYGIDTPEPHGDTRAAGDAATAALAGRIMGKEVILCTIKDQQEKYGRYLAKIYLGDELINDWMVAQGFAKPYLP